MKKKYIYNNNNKLEKKKYIYIYNNLNKNL